MAERLTLERVQKIQESDVRKLESERYEIKNALERCAQTIKDKRETFNAVLSKLNTARLARADQGTAQRNFTDLKGSAEGLRSENNRLKTLHARFQKITDRLIQKKGELKQNLERQKKLNYQESCGLANRELEEVIEAHVALRGRGTRYKEPDDELVAKAPSLITESKSIFLSSPIAINRAAPELTKEAELVSAVKEWVLQPDEPLDIAYTPREEKTFFIKLTKSEDGSVIFHIQAPIGFSGSEEKELEEIIRANLSRLNGTHRRVNKI